MPHNRTLRRICPVCSQVFFVEPYALRAGRGRHCSKLCAGRARRIDLGTYFWSRCAKSDGCWIWQGRPRRDGYGQIKIDGLPVGAHRVAWKLAHPTEEIPTGYLICHHCDTPICVRPDHLFLGTAKDNSRDMMNKGRSVKGRAYPGSIRRGDLHHFRQHPELIPRGDKSGARKHPESYAKGQDRWQAKVTEDQVREIRRLRATGALLKELAMQFGISIPTVCTITTRRNWGWLD